jgi:hypothetical protein
LTMEMENQLFVPMLRTREPVVIAEISSLLDTLERNPVGFAPWAGEAGQPKVSFVLAHGGNAFHLKYYILEKAIKAEYLNFNDPVFKDSCVEFFVAFNGDANYYNLEFNCVGTCRGMYGPDRNEREFLPPSLLKQIHHHTRFKSREPGRIEWEMTLSIPYAVFQYTPELRENSFSAKGNFYKCGDGLPEPHYLCWNKISAAEPNFHLPEFFGEFRFEHGEGRIETNE